MCSNSFSRSILVTFRPNYPFSFCHSRNSEPSPLVGEGRVRGAGIQRLSIPLFYKEGQGEVEPEALVQDAKIIGGGRRLCRNEYADFTFHLTEVA